MCAISYEPSEQLSAAENFTNDYLEYSLYNQAINCIHSRPHNLRPDLL